MTEQRAAELRAQREAERDARLLWQAGEDARKEADSWYPGEEIPCGRERLIERRLAETQAELDDLFGKIARRHGFSYVGNSRGTDKSADIADVFTQALNFAGWKRLNRIIANEYEQYKTIRARRETFKSFVNRIAYAAAAYTAPRVIREQQIAHAYGDGNTGWSRLVAAHEDAIQQNRDLEQLRQDLRQHLHLGTEREISETDDQNIWSLGDWAERIERELNIVPEGQERQ
jgi:hypothetical protein